MVKRFVRMLQLMQFRCSQMSGMIILIATVGRRLLSMRFVSDVFSRFTHVHNIPAVLETVAVNHNLMIHQLSSST